MQKQDAELTPMVVEIPDFMGKATNAKVTGKEDNSIEILIGGVKSDVFHPVLVLCLQGIDHRHTFGMLNNTGSGTFFTVRTVWPYEVRTELVKRLREVAEKYASFKQ